MKKLFKHLKTIHIHRKWVRKYCFKMGLFWQGLVHDFSKYSITELSICKYYTGKKSPHQTCRETIGYSPSWIHHYHTRNMHHFQHWWDEDELGKIIPIKMPYKYVIESFCDMLGASKSYNPKTWKPKMLLDYWNNKCRGKRLMHLDSEYLVETLIKEFYARGEKEFFTWYKENKQFLKKEYERGFELPTNYFNDDSTIILPIIGEVYQHFKGGKYRVLQIAYDVNTEEPTIVYEALYEVPDNMLRYFTRPAKEWFEHVKKDYYEGPRFVKIENEGETNNV